MTLFLIEARNAWYSQRSLLENDSYPFVRYKRSLSDQKLKDSWEIKKHKDEVMLKLNFIHCIHLFLIFSTPNYCGKWLFRFFPKPICNISQKNHLTNTFFVSKHITQNLQKAVLKLNS